MSNIIFKYCIKYLSLDLLLYILEFIPQRGPTMVTYNFKENIFVIIDNPIYFLWKKELQKNGMYLKNLIDPTKELRKIALTETGFAIKYIKNPSDEECQLAIQDEGDLYALKHIHNPSHHLLKKAVQKNGLIIQIIKDPSEEICKLAVENIGYAIKFIPNPSEEVKKISALRNRCREYDEMQIKSWNDFEYR
jgi:hypothetical protein